MSGCKSLIEMNHEDPLLGKRKTAPLRPLFADKENALTPERWNSTAKLAYKEQVMEKCPGCHRTFNGIDKLEKHMKGCDLAKAMNSSGVRDCVVHNANLSGQIATMSLSGRSESARSNKKGAQLRLPRTPGTPRTPRTPRIAKRHLPSTCGKNLGSKSISIYKAKSVKKFQYQQDEQRKSPSWTDFGSRNSIFAKLINEERMMEKCPGCGRTFNGKDKVEKHIKGCDLAKAKISAEIYKRNVHSRSDLLGYLSSNQSRMRRAKVSPSKMTKHSEPSGHCVRSLDEHNVKTKEMQKNQVKEKDSRCTNTVNRKEKSKENMNILRRSSETRECISPAGLDSISSLDTSTTSLDSSFRFLNDEAERAWEKLPPDKQKLVSSRQSSIESEGSFEDLDVRVGKEVDKNQTMDEFAGCLRTSSGENKLEKNATLSNLGEAKSYSNNQDSTVATVRDCSSSLNTSFASLNSSLRSRNDSSIEPAQACAKTPKMHVCYVCGMQFGSKSISIHEPQCLKKFLDQQALFAPEQRKHVPSRLSCAQNGESLEERNAVAKEMHESRAMEKYSECGSGKDKLEKHTKGFDLAESSSYLEVRQCIPCEGNESLRSLNSTFVSLASPPPYTDDETCIDKVGARINENDETQIMKDCSGRSSNFSRKDKLEKYNTGYDIVRKAEGAPGIRECIVPAGRDFVSSKNGTFRYLNSSFRSQNDSWDSGQLWVKAPKMHTCYICGQQFGSKSISIHEPQCLKKFKDQQALLPPGQRKPVPSRPSGGESLEERNARAKAAYEEQVMEKCTGCGRTFSGKDKLIKHQKGCDLFKARRRRSSGIRECIVPAGHDFFSSLNRSFKSMNSSFRAQQIWAKAPTLHVCYICGQQFGSKSISIHEPQCLKKFLDQQALLPPEQRKPVPLRPSCKKDGESLEERNAKAKKAHENQVMEKCPGCGRTFSGKDKLAKHMKGCDLFKARARPSGIRDCIVPAEHGSFRSRNASWSGSFRSPTSGCSDAEKLWAKAPKMHLCYICGQQFGSKSISIHEPQCLRKFKDQQALLPPEQRKPLPSRPQGMENAGSLEERNAKAKEAYEKQVMEECPGCGRTFNGKERLEKHMKGCDHVKAMRSPLTSRDCSVPAGYTSFKSPSADCNERSPEKPPKMHACYVCGKQYGSKSISIHEIRCLKKFQTQQALLPPDQRKPVPLRPLVRDSCRTFGGKDKLEKHMKGCDLAKKENTSSKIFFERINPAEHDEKCLRCGLTFSGKDKMEKHAKRCDPVKVKTCSGIRSFLTSTRNNRGIRKKVLSLW